MVPKGRPTRRNRLVKDAPDGGGQFRGARGAHRRCTPSRRKPRPIEAFTYVNVAKAGNDVLVEKDRLQRPPSPRQPFHEGGLPEVFGKGVRAHLFKQRMGGKRRRIA